MSAFEKPKDQFDSSEKSSDEILNYLNKKLPEEDLIAGESSSALLDLNSDEIFERVNQSGTFTKEDLEDLLKHEEQLLETVHFLVSENTRLNHLVNNKEDKVLAGVQLIKNQREWIHSLLEDNVTIREEVELLEEDKTENESSQDVVVNEAKNDRDEWRDKYDGVVDKVSDLTYLLEDKEKQQNKTSGDMKKMNIHKKALLEQISEYDIRHKKSKMYIGLLASAATLIFALFIGSILNENSSKGGSINANIDGLTEIPESDSKGGVTNDVDERVVEKFQDDDHTKLLTDAEMDSMFGSEGERPFNNNTKSDDGRAKVGSNVPKIRYYIVKRNDNFWKISEKFYGSGKYVNKIKRDNNLKRVLTPGTKLIITSLEEE